MYYFSRVLGLAPDAKSFSALFGIAVHDAIATWHSHGRRHDAATTIADYERRLAKEIQKANAKGFEVTDYEGEATLEKSHVLATTMLTGYVTDPRNDVELVVNEHGFEVWITSSAGTKYRFVGYIDQVRKHPDGTLHLVDLKTGKTKPSAHLLTLDEQLSLYGIATARGRFRRRKEDEPFSVDQAPATLQLAMLRDYGVYEKDQYAREIYDPSGAKVKSEKTGRMIKAKIPNPKHEEGYKKGDPRGPVFYRTLRSDFDLRQAEIDLARVCGAIRRKAFYRRPSSNGSCNFCKFQRECLEERAEPI